MIDGVTARRRVHPLRTAVLAVALALGLVGCADASDLRDEQATRFKQHCLSFALRAGINDIVYKKLERIPVERFRVGPKTVHGGVDSIKP
jgi:hypothetical protein